MVTIIRLDSQTNQPLKQWHFPEQSIIRIGRSSNNEIIVSDSALVSRHHLELHRLGDSSLGNFHWQLINKGTNGTFVNETPVSSTILKDQDLIRLAKTGPVFKFDLTSHPTPSYCTHLDNPPNNLFCIHCGQPIVAKEEFVRQYQILRQLGQGGMGTTYLAWDKSGKTTGTPLLVVIKEMNANMETVAKAIDLFEREANVLRSLHHPCIPKFYDFFVENNKKYLVMELIHGHNLEQLIHQHGPVTPQKAIDWMIQVCDILGYLHCLNPPLVHRDIKPANLILRTIDQKVILLDFGAVKEIGTPFGTVIGAEGYMAPEQEQGKPCPQSDLWAIGPSIIFLVTGTQPKRFIRLQGASIKFNVSTIPTIFPKLARVIDKACSPLAERYRTAQERPKI